MTATWTKPSRRINGLTIGFEERALHFARDLAILSDAQTAILAGYEAGVPAYAARAAVRYRAQVDALSNAR